jgi:hypothetical protein
MKGSAFRYRELRMEYEWNDDLRRSSAHLYWIDIKKILHSRSRSLCVPGMFPLPQSITDYFHLVPRINIAPCPGATRSVTFHIINFIVIFRWYFDILRRERVEIAVRILHYWRVQQKHIITEDSLLVSCNHSAINFACTCTTSTRTTRRSVFVTVSSIYKPGTMLSGIAWTPSSRT